MSSIGSTLHTIKDHRIVTERGRNHFATKFGCYIGKGRETKDLIEQSKEILPMTSNALYCRGLRNLSQQE